MWVVYSVIIVYFIIVLGFGGYFGRHARTTKDFFFSGQRFSWWLISFSCVATVVGSYSFIKYAERGLSFGMSSTMTYLNDWFLVPLFILGWLPLIYFSRVKSIPEYFERRFSRPVRVMAIIFIMLYMVGYIGINLYTMGVAVNKIAPLDRQIAKLYSPETLIEEITVQKAKQDFRLVVDESGELILDEDDFPISPRKYLADRPDHEMVMVFSDRPEKSSRFFWALVIALVAGIYVTFGGQTAVIMTDLLQGFLLLLIGVLLFYLGIRYLGQHTDMGGLAAWWSGMDTAHRMPFSYFSQPLHGERQGFPMVGIFWQDFFGSSMFFYFANQGLIMRFLAVKSVNEGRKAIIAVVLILMPLAAFAVANTGWIGASMQHHGLLSFLNPDNAFVVVAAAIIKSEIMFGIILAAITAALMSTVDTLINAVSAIAVNDILKPFIAKDRSDRFYLKWARIFSMVFTLGGLALVPVYMQFGSIYEAHGAFTAAISPPIITAIILGILWKRFSATAAFITMSGGLILLGLSLYFDGLVKPFAWIHGMDMGPGIERSLIYMRAMYGMLACTALAVVCTLIWPNRDPEKIEGLWVGSIKSAKRMFKGGEPNDNVMGEKVRLELKAGKELLESKQGAEVTAIVQIHPSAAERMKAKNGDLVYVCDKRWWLGGLRSLHATLKVAEVGAGDIVIPETYIRDSRLRTGEPVVIEKII